MFRSVPLVPLVKMERLQPTNRHARMSGVLLTQHPETTGPLISMCSDRFVPRDDVPVGLW